MQGTLVLIALLFALTFAQVAEEAGAAAVYSDFNKAYDFLDEHVIGKTLIHKEVLSAESDDSMETEVIRRHTYTNLVKDASRVKDASTFAFDVFSEMTRTVYPLDADGMRLVDRSVSEQEFFVTRWTLRRSGSRKVPGVSECLSHTESSSVGTRAVVHARWLSQGNLRLTSATLTPARNHPRSSVHPGITMQEFRVAAGVLKSKSRENLYDEIDILFAEPGKVPSSTEQVWRVENPRPEWAENIYAVLAHQESLLKALEEGGDETVFFVKQEDGYYYPCKVVGGLLESHPLQANVQSHFDSSSRRVVFSTLFLLKNLLDPPFPGTFRLEIWKDSEWVQLPHDWKNSDTGSFLGKSEAQAAWEEASLNQIRFEWWNTGASVVLFMEEL